MNFVGTPTVACMPMYVIPLMGSEMGVSWPRLIFSETTLKTVLSREGRERGIFNEVSEFKGDGIKSDSPGDVFYKPPMYSGTGFTTPHSRCEGIYWYSHPPELGDELATPSPNAPIP